MANASAYVFRQLLSRHPVTRSDLARAAQISRTYALQITHRLLTLGILTEVNTNSGDPGRPAALLQWHSAQPAYLTGLVESTHITIGWFRPGDGYLVATQHREAHHGGATVTEALLAGIEYQTATAPFPLAGIGITIPGIVDSEHGIVVQALHLNLRNVLLRDSLAQRFAVPVIIDRAAHAAALAESIYRQEKNLFYIDTGRGVGGAAIQDSQPLIGHHHAGGEIGHVVVWPDGPICDCGKQGCLEALISLPRLSRRVATLESPDPLPRLDAPAIADVSHWLTIALTNVIGILDPKAIVLGPNFHQLDDHLVTRIATKLSATTLPETRVEVSFASLLHPACEGIGMALAIQDLDAKVR